MDDFKGVAMETWKYNLIKMIREDYPISKDKIREIFALIQIQLDDAFKQGSFENKERNNVTSVRN